MKVFIITSTTNVYSDDVHLTSFLDNGDGKGEEKARKVYKDMKAEGPRDGDETGLDLWVIDVTTGQSTHLEYSKVTDEEEEDDGTYDDDEGQELRNSV